MFNGVSEACEGKDFGFFFGAPFNLDAVLFERTGTDGAALTTTSQNGAFAISATIATATPAAR